MDSYANELRDLHGLEIRNDFSRHQVRVDLSVATVKHLSLFEKDLEQMYLHFNVQMKILEEFLYACAYIKTQVGVMGGSFTRVTISNLLLVTDHCIGGYCNKQGSLSSRREDSRNYRERTTTINQKHKL